MIRLYIIKCVKILLQDPIIGFMLKKKKRIYIIELSTSTSMIKLDRNEYGIPVW